MTCMYETATCVPLHVCLSISILGQSIPSKYTFGWESVCEELQEFAFSREQWKGVVRSDFGQDPSAVFVQF